ncbi:MAG: ABC transporter ATP-binding protein [Halobacteria archaeon]|nr:ABC transporter ATP-binding protein [Halobacteria archaeon]
MISLEDVTKEYDGFSLGADLDLTDGVTAVIGPSGSGKSTLLEIIAGFETPDSGSVSLGGRRLDGVAPEDRNVGTVFQRPTLFPHLSVRQNIEYGAEFETEEIRQLCDLLEIESLFESERSPETLSGGEKRRVSVARAVVADPDALLLDEPTTGLDEPIRRRLRYELRRVLSDLDVPCVYVTHDQNEASVVADSVVVMRDGDVVQQGSYEKILDSPRNEFVADFVGIDNLIDGEVTEVAGGRTAVDIGVAEVEVEVETTQTPSPSPGSDVSVGVPSESVGVLDAGSDGGHPSVNSLDCVIERVVPERGSKTVFLDCRGSDRLRLRAKTDLPSGIDEGDEVTVEFDPSDAVVV